MIQETYMLEKRGSPDEVRKEDRRQLARFCTWLETVCIQPPELETGIIMKKNSKIVNLFISFTKYETET